MLIQMAQKRFIILLNLFIALMAEYKQAAVIQSDENTFAGLQINDIITHVNDQEITNSTDMVAAVRNAAIGDELKLTVYRMGKTTELTVTVGEQKTTTQEQEQEQTQNQNKNQGQSQWPQFPFGY